MRTALLVPLLALLLPQLGCKAMLYPAARAFGSPSEGELRKCRAAFARLKAELPTARLVVFPACDPTGSKPGWNPEAGAAMAALLKSRCAAAAPSGLQPAVPPEPYKGNQLRYLWNRARAYGQWLRQARPAGDFFCFVEIAAGPHGETFGLQLYLLDAEGQVAYLRLMNSHHFGGNPPVGPQAACELLAQCLARDLALEPETVFPPYGVG